MNGSNSNLAGCFEEMPKIVKECKCEKWNQAKSLERNEKKLSITTEEKI